MTAAGLGSTTLTVSRGGRADTVRVVVDPAGAGFPQFAATALSSTPKSRGGAP